MVQVAITMVWVWRCPQCDTIIKGWGKTKDAGRQQVIFKAEDHLVKSEDHLYVISASTREREPEYRDWAFFIRD